jgi:hypothetical protein
VLGQPCGTPPPPHQQQQQQQQQQQDQQRRQPPQGVKTAAQLAEALGVPLAVVRRKAMFWVGAGVLLQRRGAKGDVAYSRATAIDPARIGECWACVRACLRV